MAINNLPLVSVIITTYNRKDLLKNTIDSILNQTYKNFELIVVDNCSDYDFISQIKSFNDERIRLFQNTNDGIIAVNRNFGIKQSKGKYIAFCDDDDIWLPQKLEKQIKCLDNSDSGMVFTMQKQFEATSIFSNYFGIGPLPIRVDTSTKGLLNNNCIPLSTTLVRKKVLDNIGVFNEDKSYLAIEDNDLWIRISKITSIKFISKILVLHRVHQKNIYENISNINVSLKKMKADYGYKSSWNSMLFIKKNKIYFLIRNIINKLYELIFH